MTVYVAWASELPEPNLAGPWVELRVAAEGLVLVEATTPSPGSSTS
jgi:hypothetical protein